ncbi:MAG: thioredoxin [Acidobacteria bacterium]|nr:thioredoxin [Acidobacteriota bacterium]MCG2815589.1 thioredoxin [Candidatus Aminicenantes bacterium]MBU1337471.1 thioredoxin [Acidobacteriota bacterium]MBU1475483.1 thioredoxin [Acidobacteriota bacterium]MBU2437589.1 thioredoxin [Acidobacteriota bacterium]
MNEEALVAKNLSVITEQDFEDVVIKSDLPILVDFWAAWCGPCQMITPSLENIAQRYIDTLKVVKVNVDDSQTVAARYGIMSIPTLLLFKDGEVKETIVGALPQDKIEEKIKKHL